jgi:hypothetical protein
MINKFVAALAFSVSKHCDQRSQDAEASPIINHPLALVDLSELGQYSLASGDRI